MQKCRLILYKTALDMRFFNSRSMRWFKTNGVFLGEERFLPHRGAPRSSVSEVQKACLDLFAL